MFESFIIPELGVILTAYIYMSVGIWLFAIVVWIAVNVIFGWKNVTVFAVSRIIDPTVLQAYQATRTKTRAAANINDTNGKAL